MGGGGGVKGEGKRCVVVVVAVVETCECKYVSLCVFVCVRVCVPFQNLVSQGFEGRTPGHNLFMNTGTYTRPRERVCVPFSCVCVCVCLRVSLSLSL